MLVEKKSEEYPSELNRLIRRIDQLMPHPGNINETAQALTMVLWAIRDQLSFKSAIQFLDQRL